VSSDLIASFPDTTKTICVSTPGSQRNDKSTFISTVKLA